MAPKATASLKKSARSAAHVSERRVEAGHAALAVGFAFDDDPVLRTDAQRLAGLAEPAEPLMVDDEIGRPAEKGEPPVPLSG